MKYIIALIIFFSIFILVFLLPLYVLVWQEDILIRNISTTHEQSLKVDDATRYGQQIIGYLKNKQTIELDFSDSESRHMQDVKNLFVLGKWILISAICILLVMFLFLKYISDTTIFFQSVRFSTLFSLFFLFGLGVLTLMNFASSFLYFHHIFFPQGNFLFFEGTLLIQIFSERFFKETSGLLWLGSFLLTGLGLGISMYKTK